MVIKKKKEKKKGTEETELNPLLGILSDQEPLKLSRKMSVKMSC